MKLQVARSQVQAGIEFLEIDDELEDRVADLRRLGVGLARVQRADEQTSAVGVLLEEFYDLGICEVINCIS